MLSFRNWQYSNNLNSIIIKPARDVYIVHGEIVQLFLVSGMNWPRIFAQDRGNGSPCFRGILKELQHEVWIFCIT